jgi:CheY-like chemotaxis protein
MKKQTEHTVWAIKDLLTVSFDETVNCVLIPSRHDYKAQGLVPKLWYNEYELQKATEDAQSDLMMTIPANVSTLSLYAALNLLYRPCSIKGKIRHFNVLIVDDSVVARKMMTLQLVQRHKDLATDDSIYIHHADSYASALQIAKKKTFNVMIIDHILTTGHNPTYAEIRHKHSRHASPRKSALKGSTTSGSGSGSNSGSSVSSPRQYTRREVIADVIANLGKGVSISRVNSSDSNSYSSGSGLTHGSPLDDGTPPLESAQESVQEDEEEEGELGAQQERVRSHSGDRMWRDVCSPDASDADLPSISISSSGSSSRSSNQNGNEVATVMMNDSQVRVSISAPTTADAATAAVKKVVCGGRGGEDSVSPVPSANSNGESCSSVSSGVTDFPHTSTHSDSGADPSSGGSNPSHSGSANGSEEGETSSDAYHGSSISTGADSGSGLVPHKYRRDKGHTIEWSTQHHPHPGGNYNPQYPHSGGNGKQESGGSLSLGSGDAATDHLESRNRSSNGNTFSNNTLQMTTSTVVPTANNGGLPTSPALGSLRSSSNLAALLAADEVTSESSESGHNLMHHITTDSTTHSEICTASSGSGSVASTSSDSGGSGSGSGSGDAINDTFTGSTVDDKEAMQRLGLGGKARNSMQDLSKAKYKKEQRDKKKKQQDEVEAEAQGMPVAGGAGSELSVEAPLAADADPQHVVVGVEGKLRLAQPMSQEAAAATAETSFPTATAGVFTPGMDGSQPQQVLRMSDLYGSSQSLRAAAATDGIGGSNSDFSVNSLTNRTLQVGPSLFESYKEPKLQSMDLDPNAWNGKDIIEVIREDTPCLIIGISGLIISDFDEAYDEHTHTVSAIQASNQLRAELVRAGADLVWAKPLPHDAWEQIYHNMPLEF